MKKILIALLIVFICIPISLLFLIVPIYLLVGSPYEMNGAGMSPNYTSGQFLMTKRISFDPDLQRGDVVIHKDPKGNPHVNYIKRIVGLPGEKVMTNKSLVYINGKVLDESSYLPKGTLTAPGTFLGDEVEVTIPENEYFLLGDNRTRSLDSREIGFIPKENITNKVWFCYWNCEAE